jgi:hypothetical protein
MRMTTLNRTLMIVLSAALASCADQNGGGDETEAKQSAQSLGTLKVYRILSDHGGTEVVLVSQPASVGRHGGGSFTIETIQSRGGGPVTAFFGTLDPATHSVPLTEIARRTLVQPVLLDTAGRLLSDLLSDRTLASVIIAA